MVVLAALVPATAIVVLLGSVLWISAQESVVEHRLTAEHYVELFTDPAAFTALLNTGVFSASVVFWAMLFGLPIAWLIERTDLGMKATVSTVMTLGVLIPGFMNAIG